MEFFDGWKTLNARFDKGDLTALTQLVGYKLFVIFDEQRFPESLPISDRELMSRTGIQSGQTIVEARRRLKNAGLIDFDTRKGKITRYRLTLDRSSTDQAVIKQSPSSNQAVGEIPINTRAPRYTPILKEEEAHTRGSYGGDGLTVEETVALDALVDEWQDSPVFCKLDVKLVSQLAALLKEHGAAAMRTAMEAARRTQKSGVNLAYFTRALKGGDTRDRGIVYEAVDTDWIQAADG